MRTQANPLHVRCSVLSAIILFITALCFESRAATGNPPKDLRLADGTPLTQGATGVPVDFRCYWTPTDHATHMAARLIDLADGRVIVDRADAVTPTLGRDNLKMDHRYRIQVRNITSRDDPWLTVDFRTRAPGTRPSIVNQPRPVATCPNTQVSLNVMASGTGPLSYQWQRDRVDIPGATKASLQFIATDETAGRYRVIVRNLVGERVSDEVSVDLQECSAPEIEMDLEDAELPVGAPLRLEVVASGSGALRYAWFKDGAPTPGLTGPVLNLGSVTKADSGEYKVIVSNDHGTAESAAVVTVGERPQLKSGPQSLSVDQGQAAELAVEATGTDLSYQWYFNGVADPEQMDPSWIFDSVTVENQGEYYCEVSNGFGQIKTPAVRLTIRVVAPPVIKRQPKSAQVDVHGTARLEVVAAGRGPLQYQWYQDDVELPDGTEAVLEIRDVTPEARGDYFVIVSNGGGEVTSSTVKLSVRPVFKAGQFNGLFQTPDGVRHESSGRASLSVDRRGRLTGNLVMGANRFPISGQFNDEGIVQLTATARGGPSLTVAIEWSEEGELRGSVAGTGWSAELVLDVAAFGAQNPCPWAGTYTWFMPADPAIPEAPGGNGYATFTVRSNGTVEMSGKLADDTALTVSSVVGGNGAIPVYASLNGGKGSLLGWVNLSDGAVSGRVSWIRTQAGKGAWAAGFETELASIGASMLSTEPLLPASRRLVLMIGLPDEAEPLVIPLTLKGRTKIKAAVSGVSVELGANGKFTASVKMPAGQPALKMSGLILQSELTGYGYCLVKGTSQPVFLGESPTDAGE